jgi:hypothetical protein
MVPLPATEQETVSLLQTVTERDSLLPKATGTEKDSLPQMETA